MSKAESIYVSRRYHFESAHFLPHVRDGHKCKNMHGHNYEIVVTVFGDVQPDGFIIDFWDLDDVLKPILTRVDHHTLNDVDGLDNPTAENIADWFCRLIIAEWRYRKLNNSRPIRAVKVECFETKDCSATAIRPVE
jgi:6-pyruvoyltetrahydropterin/6-carboxytetrahydropterin synthase